LIFVAPNKRKRSDSFGDPEYIEGMNTPKDTSIKDITSIVDEDIQVQTPIEEQAYHIKSNKKEKFDFLSVFNLQVQQGRQSTLRHIETPNFD